MKINIAVVGKFHVFNYAPYLIDSSVLNKFYYSHKKKTAELLGGENNFVNFPLKEYLSQIHGRLFGDFLYEKMMLLYLRSWEKSVIKSWSNCDVLHVLCQGAAVRVIDKAKKNGTKVLCEVVNTNPLNRFNVLKAESDYWGLNLNKKEVFKRELQIIEEVSMADAILSPSDAVSNSYKKYSSVEKTIYKIPYAVNAKRFENFFSYRNNNKIIKILSVGEIGLRKGQLRFLDIVKKNNFICDITLVGVINPVIKNLLLKYAESFTHIERVPSQEMPLLMAAHDIYVAPSFEEGLALSVAEAMAAGLAVIASKESGAGEIIINGVDGLLYDAGNDQQLSTALALFIDNNDYMKNIGFNAKKKSSDFLTWSNYATELIKVYKKLSAS